MENNFSGEGEKCELCFGHYYVKYENDTLYILQNKEISGHFIDNEENSQYFAEYLAVNNITFNNVVVEDVCLDNVKFDFLKNFDILNFTISGENVPSTPYNLPYLKIENIIFKSSRYMEGSIDSIIPFINQDLKTFSISSGSNMTLTNEELKDFMQSCPDEIENVTLKLVNINLKLVNGSMRILKNQTFSIVFQVI